MQQHKNLDLLESCSYEQFKVLHYLSRLAALPQETAQQLEASDLSRVMKEADCEWDKIIDLQSKKLLLLISMTDRIIVLPTEYGIALSLQAELLGYGIIDKTLH